MRIRVLVSVAWAAAVTALALYESSTADPWRMFGPDMGTLFFTRSLTLVYSDFSPFGEYTLEFHRLRFALLAFTPLALVWGPKLVRLILFLSRR